MTNLTSHETKAIMAADINCPDVLDCIEDNATWLTIADLVSHRLTVQQAKGVLASLVKKGLVEFVDDDKDVRNDTLFCLTEDGIRERFKMENVNDFLAAQGLKQV